MNLRWFGAWMETPPTRTEFVIGAFLFVMIVSAEYVFIPPVH